MQLESQLGFDRIRALVAEECTNTLALRMVADMAFMTNEDKLQRELDLVEELRQIILLESSFPSQDFFDLTDELLRLKVGNTVIEQAELFNLKCSLRTLSECLRFLLRDDQQRYPRLKELAARVEVDPALSRNIAKLIDDKGELYDSASPELLEIRQQMRRKQAEVDSQISRSLSRAKHEGWAPEGAEVTIRNGRLVIPMLDTHRRKMKGLIHDESATRQTAFLEPAEVVELNNDLRELEFAERHEIQRILARFSDALRPQLPLLINAYWFLARVDFLRAKARFALSLNAGHPVVTDCPRVSWYDARHPLLYHNYLHAGQREVVPFSLSLDNDSRILIISGPNAGGKSVCLKAVGLIQYMFQCGLLVPCRETSEFGIFDRLFIDIGDQQSIDDDLSTYTSHLQHMKQLLQEASDRTLFLLDELGGGTEPRSGCAIAEAVLEALCLRGAFGVVTTHFADLKLMADHFPQIVNGAMLFDTERMRPLYRLSIGHPGSSFAFEIAANIGFPEAVLKAAGEKVGGAMLNFEHQLQQIELDKQEIARQRTQLQVQDQFLNEVVEKYQKLSEKLESRRHEIISSARNEARQILADANRTVEQTISDIKSAKAEKEATQAARQRMRAEAERLASQQEKHDERLQDVRAGAAKASRHANADTASDVASSDNREPDEEVPVAVGTIVRIDDGDTYGQVVELKGRKAVVESNALRMTIALDRLKGTRKKMIPADRSSRGNSRFQSIFDDINEKRKFFNPTLDLRGQRADEALVNLQRFLDEAQLLSEKELRILHGKGYGILKQMIRDYLQHNAEVRSFQSERLELGGDGITLVHLR